MKKFDNFESNILARYEKGELKSTSSEKIDLEKLKEAAVATFVKNKRVKLRLCSPNTTVGKEPS